MSYQPRGRTFDQFNLGDTFVCPARTVTEADTVKFAGVSGDYNPLHMDEEYARTTVFGGRVAHGPLTFALAIGLVYQTGFYGNSILAWLGVENMKIPAPVRIGDSIRVRASVSRRRETKSPDRGLTVFRWDVLNQRDEAVMSLDYLLMMYRRPVAVTTA